MKPRFSTPTGMSRPPPNMAIVIANGVSSVRTGQAKPRLRKNGVSGRVRSAACAVGFRERSQSAHRGASTRNVR
jgi:hypothetical protein